MKKLFLFLIVALLLGSTVPLKAENSPANTIRIPKVISLVYDDSGSMYSDPDTAGNDDYANYAVKLLLSLLNPEDQAYLTLMSEPEKSIKVDLSQGAGTAIRQLDDVVAESGTPIGAVETAVKALVNHQTNNQESDYWLLIFSDGEFHVDAFERDADTILKSLLQAAMPNNSQAQVAYISIGSSAYQPGFNHQNLHLYPANGRSITQPSEIVRTMEDLANRISGRSRIASDRVSVSGNTVTFTTELPSFSIGFLLQENDRSWQKLTIPTGEQFPVNTQPIIVKSFPDLRGFTGIVRDDVRGALPAGTYEVTFAQPPKNFAILTEPALVLDIKAEDIATGRTDDASLLTAKAIDIKGHLHVWNETEPVNPNYLPENTVYYLELAQDGQEKTSTSQKDLYLPSVSLAMEDALVTGRVDLPGIGAVSARRSIKMPGFGLLVENDKTQFTLRELVGNDQGMSIDVTFNGEAITGQQMSEYGISIQAECELPLQVSAPVDGKFTVYPALSTLSKLDNYGELPVKITLMSHDKAITTEQSSFMISPPQFSISGNLMGTDQMSQINIPGNRNFLDELDEGKLKELGKTQVIAQFKLLLDGKPLTQGEYLLWGEPSLALQGSAAENLQLATLAMADGSIIAAPWNQKVEWSPSALLPWFNSWLAWHGSTGVSLTFQGHEMTVPFDLVRGPLWMLVLSAGLPLLLLVLLIGYLSKRRFANGAVVTCADATTSDGIMINATSFEPTVLRQWNIWSFIPFARARTTVGGLKFYAGKDTFVLTKRDKLPDASRLIGSEQSVFHGRFQADTKEDSLWRPIKSAPDEEQTSYHFEVLALNDVLVMTGDRRTGRLYQYKLEQ